MFGRVAREDGLGGQHLKETTKPALQRDFAGQTIFMVLRAAELGQQLHFGPFEGHAQVKEKACRDPAQGDYGAGLCCRIGSFALLLKAILLS